MVPRRTVCGEAVERSAGRSGIVSPSSTLPPGLGGCWASEAKSCAERYSDATMDERLHGNRLGQEDGR